MNSSVKMEYCVSAVAPGVFALTWPAAYICGYEWCSPTYNCTNCLCVFNSHATHHVYFSPQGHPSPSGCSVQSHAVFLKVLLAGSMWKQSVCALTLRLFPIEIILKQPMLLL